MPASSADRLLAHGVGGSHDLPVPASYAFLGAAAALVVSFCVLALAWRSSRFRGDDSGRPLPRWLARTIDARLFRGVVVTLALLFTAWLTLAALAGADSVVNPVFRGVYVFVWVGLVPASLLFGPVYRLCNPLRWLHRGVCRLADISPTSGIAPYPRRLGMWPAAGTLLAFVWLELVNPAATTDLTTVTLWFATVGALLFVGAAIFGDTFFAHADPFEVYSSLVARLSPFGRRTDGVLVVRNPLENLDGLAAQPGLVAVVSVLFGSTGFDSFKDTTRWLSFSQQHTAHSSLLNGAALVCFCLIVFATFSAAAMATAGLGTLQVSRMPRLLAHSVVPIVIGYVVAHYLSYFVAEGIAFFQELGDPLSRGWRLTAFLDDVDKFWIYNHPRAIAVTKVVAVIVGHVLGVVAAHDRSVRLLPRRKALTGQLPMLVLMVAYTLTGLWLLFAS